jgi:hypothetical protein
MRTLSTAFGNALDAQSVSLTYLVELVLDSGTLRFNTSGVDVSWSSQTWTGAGTLGRIEQTAETTTGDVPGLRMDLSGIPSSLVTVALSEHVQGRVANVYLATFDANGAVITSPVLEWSGLIDTMSIGDGGETSTISLTVESRLIDYRRPRIKRFNSTDHQRDHATDEFFSHVEAMAEKSIVWPNKEWWKK